MIYYPFLSNRNVIFHKPIESDSNIIQPEKLDVSDFSDEVIEMTKMGKIFSNI